MSTGTIHDIGYRGYDGARLGRGYVMRSLAVHNLRAAYGLGRPARAKVMPFMLAAVMLLPALGSVAIVALTKDQSAMIKYSEYAVIMQMVVAIYLATQAPVLVSRELRHRVTPLYFSRPIGALDFVLAKFAAFTVALFALLAVPITVLYAGMLVTRQPGTWRHTGDYLLAVVGCLLFALVLAGIGLVVAAFTPRRGFGVAAVIAVILLSSAVVDIVQNLVLQQGETTVAGLLGLFTPFLLVQGVQYRLLGGSDIGAQPPPDGYGGPVFLLGCAVVVAVSLAALTARFRKAGLA